MRPVEEIMQQAEQTGRLQIVGEMNLPANEGPAVAYATANMIAEECGYLAGWRSGHSAITISGAEIPGYVVLDWMHPGAKRVQKIELWTCQTAYANKTSEAQ